MQTTVGVCDTEPVGIEGLRAVLGREPEFCLTGAERSLVGAISLVQRQSPHVMILDKAFGVNAVLDWIASVGHERTIVWGGAMNESEILRLMQGGARAVVRKSVSIPALLACIRSVAVGKVWVEDPAIQRAVRPRVPGRSNLTAREQQVAELIEQGYKNKDIAAQLGIRPGTVKIHLKHIFEKTGIHGRYGVALSGLREKGLLSVPTVAFRGEKTNTVGLLPEL